jgi:1-acyl-sn-glycerol-3-phosphate acyltransferase
MLRFYYVIITAAVFNLYFIPQMYYMAKHPEKYNERDCYRAGLRLVNMIKRRGRISTHVTGQENLPEQGGYIMYANHQGKYDALGILSSHTEPCTIVMDKETSESLINNLFINLIKGKRLDKKDPRQQVRIIQEISAEINQGRRYLLFPEGGYTDNHNRLQEFHSGSFKIPIMTKCPIIPVVIFDSYRAFSKNSLRRIKTQVHYLAPIYYEEYGNMKTKELCDLVYNRIFHKLNEIQCFAASEPEHDEKLEELIS